MPGKIRKLLTAWLLTTAMPSAVAEAPQEVIVTATRFRQALAQYAGSATRLDNDALAARGATHYADALNLAAGVHLQRGSGQEGLLAIRSPVLTGPGACGAFLILEDGMPLRPPGFCNLNELFEVNTEQAAAIEVLRGPGSAAYGAHALHGIVNVQSRVPDALARPRVALRGGDFSYREVSAETALGNPQALSFGAYGLWRHDGGWRAQSDSDEGKINLAAQWRRGTGTWTWRAAGSVLNQETAGFIRGFDSYRDPALARANANPEAFRDAWSARSSLQYSANTCPGCETAAYLLYRRTDMRFLQHFLLGKPLEQNGHWSLAAGWQRRAPAGSATSWQWGADLGYMDSELLQRQAGPTLEGSVAARAIRPAGRHYDYRVIGLTASANGALEQRLTSTQSLAVQLRLERTHYRHDNRMAAGNLTETGASCTFGGCLYNRPADRSDAFTDTAARFEWRWRPRAGDVLFAAAARGFRPPEATELYRLQRGQDIATLDSESLSGLEVGWRRSRERWSMSLAAFAQDKRNVLLRDANGFNIDAGRTRHHGVEYEIAAALGEHWRAELAGSWSVHRYGFDRVIEGGETVTRGTEIDTAPRHLASLRLGWRPHSKLNGDLHVRHVGGYFVDASGARRYPGHTIAAASFSWRVTRNHELRAHVDNLFDRRYADRADFAQGDYRYFPASGRRWFLEYAWARR